MRTLDLQEFVDEIYEDYKSNDDTKYIFFLGAGCSKSSGVPLASELAQKWYEELKKQKTKFDKFNDINSIESEGNIKYAKHYFKIFEALFPTPITQQNEIQKLTEDKTPSLGYYILSELMQIPAFNTILTTNFDNLIQDALIYSGNKRALVITHQDLAQFIERNNTPLITKVHGDAHMHPFNNTKQTQEIPKELKSAIQGLFINTKVICIGYGGDDKSMADLLESCNRIDQVYWLNASEPKDVKMENWWKKLQNKTYIKEYDFDKIMSLIKSKFGLASPDFDKRTKVLKASYDNATNEEINDINNIENKTFIDYFLLANTYYDKKEYDNAIDAYKKAIEINPKDDNAYYNMGHSYSDKKEYDNAIDAFKKAIKINPKKEEAYNNMGTSYTNKKEYDNAIDAFKKAIEINPKYSHAYYNMGNSYNNNQEYDNAIDAFKKVIEINPKDDEAYINIFEIQIIVNNHIDETLENKYISMFKEEKNIFIEYTMLKILLKISQNIKVDINKLENDYKNESLHNWSFHNLDKWVDTKEKDIKKKLLDAMRIFKNKQEK